MQVTDQPGRILAVVLVAPLLFYMGHLLVHGTTKVQEIGRVVMCFAAFLFVYECFWLTRTSKCAKL